VRLAQVVQSVLVLERDGGGAAPRASLSFRVTGAASRLLTDVVGVAQCLVLEGVRAGAWGALQLPWPLPAGVMAQVVYHVSPTLVPGWADQRHYALALALALLSALCGRGCVPGLVAVGELTMGGQLLPIHGSDGDLLAMLHKTVGREPGPTTLLMSSEAALKIKACSGPGRQPAAAAPPGGRGGGSLLSGCAGGLRRGPSYVTAGTAKEA
jgi:hypothetical protein